MGVKKRLLRMLTIAVMPLFLSGCGPDLGVFEHKDVSDYYDSFGDVTGLYDGGSKDYDVENSLYNTSTLNDFSWEKDEYKVEYREYLYIIIPFEAELKIQAMVLYFNVQTTVNVKLSCFYFANDSLVPSKIKYLSSPDTEIIDDHEEEILYDDPPASQALVTGEANLTQNKWMGVVLDKFQQVGHNDNYLYTEVDSLFYLRIENNSGFNRDTMTNFSFSFTNMMVRAVEEGE